METELKDLVGKKVLKIFINEEYLRFETDEGILTYQVTGDCCSHSFFYDFYGVDNLLKNGKVLSVKEVELTEDRKVPKPDNDSLAFYGYSITTESAEFGEVTSVFSFRNDSNGYYGGSIDKTKYAGDIPEITKDVSEVK